MKILILICSVLLFCLVIFCPGSALAVDDFPTVVIKRGVNSSLAWSVINSFDVELFEGVDLIVFHNDYSVKGEDWLGSYTVSWLPVGNGRAVFLGGRIDIFVDGLSVCTLAHELGHHDQYHRHGDSLVGKEYYAEHYACVLKGCCYGMYHAVDDGLLGYEFYG